MLRFRTERRLSTRQLAALLAEVGRPLQPTAITKIESGDRRVDVGDLAALAEVFGVSMLTLLLPDDNGLSLGNEIKKVVAGSGLPRPYIVEVRGFTDRPDNIGIWSGEGPVRDRQERGDG